MMWIQRIINTIKFIYNQIIPRQFKISLVAMVCLLFCYALLRLGFFIANHQFFTGVGTREIILSFIYGLRFDISALLLLNGPLLVIYNLPGNLTQYRWIRIILLVFFFALNIAGIILNLADYAYFPTIQRRLMSEIYTILPDIIRSMPSFLAEYYYLVLILILGGASFVFINLVIFKKLNRILSYQFNLYRDSACFIILGALMLLGIRGGFQSIAIRQGHAFFSSNRVVGYLTLNSTFTVLRSLSQAKLRQIHLLPAEEARASIAEMLRQENEEMVDPQYPFLRKKSFPDNPRKLNVVIFIMESWTADYIGSISGQPSVTPFFDSLAVSGTLFTNFLANGQRSVVAATSILSSIPGFYSNSIVGRKKAMIGSESELNSFLGLGTILLKQGYTTSFIHGAKTGSMGFDAYAKLSGLLNYYGKEDYPNLDATARDGVWGIWDEEFFLDAARRMNSFKEPFCSIIFSLTSHDPFKISPHRESLFQQYSSETKYQRVIRYSDYSLEQFFKASRNKPWFKNTIFMITGDHTNYARGNNFHSYFNVPLLIYAPGLIDPKRCEQVGAQVDILPTILDLLHISTIHNSMGRSLLDTSQTHYIVVTDGAQYAVFSDQFVLLNDLEKNVGLYDYHSDPFFKNDLQTKYPEIAGKLKRNLYSYIQEVSTAIAKNKICRNSDLK